MNIAEMRSRIVIYPMLQTVDEYGSVVTTQFPTPIGDFWAKVEDRNSGSNYSQLQQLTTFDYKITIRDSTMLNVNTDCFVRWNNKQLKIEGIERKDEGKRRFLILRCSTIGS